MFIVHYLCFDKVERGKESFLMDDNDNWTCSAIEIKTNMLARTGRVLWCTFWSTISISYNR